MSVFKHLAVKPWERKGVIGGLKPEGAFDSSSEKVALVFFLVIASVVFSMFTVSYFIRMELPDWAPISEPQLLWVNTGILVMSSVLFQWARNITKVDKTQNIFTAYVGAGLLALGFIAGQYLSWQNLQAQGLFLADNPANAFYYLLTGLHALHLLGGLWVWSVGLIRLASGTEPKELKQSIELCALYWHFLLIVWLVLFAVLVNT
jgi:cytochrome c oxidase subunit 3